MRVETFVFWTAAIIGVWWAAAQDVVRPNTACVEFNQNIVTKLDSGLLAESEALLSAALIEKEINFEPSCLATILHNLANVLALSGRFAEAEGLAQRSIKLLAAVHSVQNPALFRPLHLLWSTQFLQGERSKARQTFQKMKVLQLAKAQDRAMLHGAAASEMQVDGRYEEAQREYQKALVASVEAGRGETGDYAILLTGLGTQQLFQNRYLEAGATLDLALSVATSAKDAVPMDLIKILSVRAVLWARQAKWQAAAQDLKLALLIADRDARLDPGELKPLLANFGYVLRKAHRGKEARAIESRVKSINTVPLANAIVDVRELSKKPIPRNEPNRPVPLKNEFRRQLSNPRRGSLPGQEPQNRRHNSVPLIGLEYKLCV